MMLMDMKLISLITLNAAVMFTLVSAFVFPSFAETRAENSSVPFVCGRLSDSVRYERLNPRFKKVFDFLQNTDLNALPDGKVEIDGENAFAFVSTGDLVPIGLEGDYEAHRQYIDIHVPLTEEETIGTHTLTERELTLPFNEKDDYVLYKANGDSFTVKPGEFAVFFPPYGGHRPGCTSQKEVLKGHRKLCVKVKVGADSGDCAECRGFVGPRVVLELPPGPGNPRNSEGDFAVLKDGSILFVYTHYTQGTGGDHDPAMLCSRVSLDGGQTWSAESKEFISNEGGMNVMCVSFLRLRDGALALFYLLKNSKSDCRPVMRVSRDEGKSWSKPVKCIPDSEKDYYVFENCRAERLSSGRIVLPMCLHASRNGVIGDWHGKLVCWFSDDEGRNWRRGAEPFAASDAAGNRLDLQEPGIVELNDGRVLMYARTSHGRQWFFVSSDRAETWSNGRPSQLIGPCSPATLKRLSNGDLVAVWNDHADYPEYAARDGKWGTRIPMAVAVSKDDGLTWGHRQVVGDERDGGWYCYFGVLEHGGNLLVGYCAKDGLKHLRITSIPMGWIYGGGASCLPRRGFAGIREGTFWALSTVVGVWSAKPGDAEVRTWDRGKGVRIMGGENRRAYLELPIGVELGDVRLFAERFASAGLYEFKVEGRKADGSWIALFSQGDEALVGKLKPIRFTDGAAGVTALRFTCTSSKGVLITD